MIDAFVNQMLLDHKLIIGVFAVAMKIKDGLTLMFEFLDILPDASIGLIKFFVPFLPRIEHDGFEQLFVFDIRFDSFQKLNELLLEYDLLNGFRVGTLLAAVMIIRVTLAPATTRKTSSQWLIAMLTNNEPPQGKSRIVKHTRLALEMKSALHVLALSEQSLIDNGLKIAFRHLPERLDSTTIHGVCDDLLERLLNRIFILAGA